MGFKQILIIEDDIASNMLFQEIFQQTNYKLTVVNTAKEAISVLKKEDSFDLILLDIKLPDNNGYDLLLEIKRLTDDIPIIAQTAHAMRKDKEKCLKMGFSDYISKPVNWQELLHLVEKHLSNNKN